MRRRSSVFACAAAIALVVGGDRDARAQPAPPLGAPSPGAPLPDDVLDPEGSSGDIGTTLGASIGPVVQIEDIVVVGNRSTARRVIERALPFSRGDMLRPSDPRLARAHWKLLALGYFREVDVALRKGSAHGRVIVSITVAERGTVALNRMWFGSSAVAPWWLGADVSDRNFAGTGLVVGGGAVYASPGSITGARAQWAGELRLAAPALRGSRWGAHVAMTGQHGSEPFRVTGPAGTGEPDDLRAFAYRRLGGRAGPSLALSALTSLSADVRVEAIDAAVPIAPTRTLPDGRVAAIDLGLRRGDSRVVSFGFGLVRDNRPDPALPHRGTRVEVVGELGTSLLGGSYDFAVLLGRYDRFWPLTRRHAIGLRLAGGTVIGDAPRFDRLHIGDVDRMLSPRVLGMTTALTAPLDLLGTDNADAVYGELGGSVVAEYAYRWWRRPNRIYGGDVFVAVGLWGLATTDELRVRDRGWWSALPVDAVVDVGLRIDTEIGVFEFSIANGLGRVPRW
ncbi:MAG: BamA/TamA family outer membrane protein [Myxococcales bacterium]|nr:BamA/TamA family outer membrane protein [Myxococcales bacterium]